MPGGIHKEHIICFVIESRYDGSRTAHIVVRLTDGQRASVSEQHWPSGAPTPHQLELLEARLIDEMHHLVLGVAGVQGVLYPGEIPRG